MDPRRIGALALVLITGMLALGSGNAAAVTMSGADTGQTLAAYTQALASGTPSADYFAEDAVLIFEDSGQQVHGRAAVTAAIADLLHGAFAGRMTITALVVGGSMAATSGEFVGTQIGVFAGLAATGHSVAVPYAAFYEVVDGRIAVLRLDLSTVEILRQLAVPPADEMPIHQPSGNPY
jgi:predicted ester cyclase